ncbi:MAG: glycosyltransferase family 2 protein [Steroidobacteraceae bacterium]
MNSPPLEALVSIPLCTYNGKRFLAAQLDSLLNQTHANLEVLAFDDGSQDGTVEILLDYAGRDARLRVHVNPLNLGFRANFLQAIRACGGEFIAPCDQDDIWLPEKLTALIECIGDRALAYCNSRLVDATAASLHARVSDYVTMIDGDNPAPFAFGNCVSGHAMMFHSRLLAKLSTIPSEFFHDWWIAAVAASSGGIVYCDRELVWYRQHGENVTNMMGQRFIVRANRPDGYRLRELREVGRRLEKIATLECQRQRFIRRFSVLWIQRETQWCSWRLCWLMLCHGVQLRRIEKQSRYKIIKDALQMLPGIKLKRLVSPRAYVADAGSGTHSS